MKRIALIGSYPPRKCGIATFMHDLNQGIRANGIETSVITLNDGLRNYQYPSSVKYTIEQQDHDSYLHAADFINTSRFDAVVLQHEFGIFGGENGEYILKLLERLKMPVVTTFHTILDTPTDAQREIVRKIAEYSSVLVSISEKGLEFLENIYGIPRSKCRHIHHGTHQIQVASSEEIKKKLGIGNEKILLTFGLLSRNKSIEVVIKALPEVIKIHPDLIYYVLGATHPHVIRHEGEAYRRSLKLLAEQLGLSKHVVFIDRFVSNENLFEFLKICDIYVIPYLGEKQISSGTLMYAMGAGKPVVSTPFWYAREMLAENRGVLFDFNNSGQLATAINDLLGNDAKSKEIAANAKALARECDWPHIGRAYMELLEEIVTEKNENRCNENLVLLPPAVNLKHLCLLSDDTGIMQHARYSIPNRDHGYCVDDNSRALMLTVMLQHQFTHADAVYRLTTTYLSFIDYAFNEQTGRFRNFMSYDRHWLEEEGSEDSAARTIWALGYTAGNTNSADFFRHSNYLFHKGLENIGYISHPRALAYLVLGLYHFTNVHDDTHSLQLLQEKAQQLSALFDRTIDQEWLWFDDVVSYANSRIPEALLAAGKILGNQSLVGRGIKILDWLIEKQFEDDIFTPIGNFGWMTPDSKAPFDQQPLEAHGMLDACLQAEDIFRNGHYFHYATKAFEWFTGNNTGSCILYDAATGGCRDGLNSDGVNLNQGAESTLSWLMSLLSITAYNPDKNK